MSSIIPLPLHAGISSPDENERAGMEPIQGVSSKLIPVRLIANTPWWLFFLLICVAWHVLIAYLDWAWWLHLFAIVVYALVAQSILLTPRRTRAIGYATRENELIYRSGLLFRSLTVLPYGRVQDIEIAEGPIERKYGLSTVTLKTAAGTLSDITIPGLERAESERIRDLVTREAHEKMAAL